MKSRLRTWLALGAALVVAVPVVAAGAAYLIARATVTPLSGQLALPGLAGPVDIVRDREGVPHIQGQTLEDLYAGLGFVHAQDRLWQMELIRRAAQGRLSEVFGTPTVATDVFLRSLDFYGHVERTWTKLDARSRTALEAYARGVNAFLQRPVGLLEARLPPEFLILRHQPEPWRAIDSIAALKMMALNLSTNMEHEITRLTYAAQGFGPAEIEDLMPTDDAKAPPLPDLRQLYTLRPLRSAAALQPSSADDIITGGASNNWVVSGARSRTGKPLLANDPHLRLSAPSTWYFAHTTLVRPGAAPRNIAGASLAGTPLIVLGRSDTLAWGFTNTGADVQDIFIERLNPDNPGEYQTPEGWQRFVTDTVEIRVKGADTRTLHRRWSRHGPVLPESYRNLGALLGPTQVAALKWTALTDDDTTIVAGMLDPDLRTVNDYMMHMRPYIVPIQSMVAADSDGNIGMIAPGHVPIRDPANKVAGRAPVPGWDASYDWTSTIPFEDLPRRENPPDGAIGTANASIVGPDYPYLITLDWDTGYRQERINELILSRTNHDVASMKAGQLDVLSLAVLRLKPLMLEAARRAGSTETETMARLAAWDSGMRGDAAEPLMFMAWLRETVRAIYADDLGPAFQRFFNPHAPVVQRLLEGKATGRNWCDDTTTTAVETCDMQISRALTAALTDLTKRYGGDRRSWRWDTAHTALSDHQALGSLPVLGALFNVHVPSPGGPYTLDRGMVDFGAEPPFANRGAASSRAVYDFADLDNSLFIHTTGQSGNPFSPFYRSLAERWSKGEYIRIPTQRAEIDRQAIGTWRLSPR